MSAPWHDIPTRAPSPDFAARVAQAARKDYVARRTKRVALGVSALAVAAAAAFIVRMETGTKHAATGDEARTAIGPDVPRIPAGSITWPIGKGWTEEVFKFPLSFAPDIPYRGMVGIHFSPTFMRPGTDGYWSYVPVWVKAGVPASAAHDPRQLERDLGAYYTGLCGTGGHPVTHTQSPGFVSHGAHLSAAPLPPEDRAAGGEWFFKGDLQAVDCIVTGGELALDVEAVVGACDEHTSFTTYLISPRPSSDPIWDDLRAERRAFDCRHAAASERAIARSMLAADASAPIPDTPAGHALTWIAAAIVHPPTEAEVTTRFSRAFLDQVSAAKVVEFFEQLGEAYSPPVVERVLDATPNGLTVVVRSGDLEAPILGRRRTLRLAVDPKDPTRLDSLAMVPETGPGAPEPAAR